ncbi:hypothetical protein GFY24_01720 [Nocardia sp. SYP-A9097]|uniref:hypothetical protein n=1 Tax=Nocardia sp. SYP-A9097 TaxID=2663237 RepID=UPI00129B7358|nr:hypothetical protein [Nocardia sp. SYP-A9097]MRH86194.1 hypothetical protein [Nocardia sp. SYP-A9097]
MHESEPNHLFLDREAIRDLSSLLREIPDIAADLEDSVTRRSRFGAPNSRLASRSGDQPLPFSPAAARARDHLHAVLVSWVRLVCEQRAVDYTGATSTADLARWLDHNLIALAMTEGVETAPSEIRAAIQSALQIICPATTQLTVTTEQLEAARRACLNVTGIATLAKELGEPFKTVTVRRIQTLRDAGRITPVPGPWAADWPEQYILGEVLEAHLAHPIRKRKAATRCEPHQPLLRVQEQAAG